MNERNVEALAYLVEELPVGEGMPQPIRLDFCRMLAESLARGGALVPSALTDKDCAEVGAQQNRGRTLPILFRRALERIAKGEPVE